MIKFILLVVIGFILLIKGADIFVDGISSLASNLKIPKLIIALSIVAFGTSAPELFISFNGLIGGNDDVVLANVIGSTVVNSMLIIGIAAIINPIRVKSETIKKQLPLHLIIILIFSILLLDKTYNGTINTITRSDALILFIIFLSFVYYIYKFYLQSSKNQPPEINNTPKWNLRKSIIFSALGLVAIAYGSDIAVENCVNIARALHVSEKLITMVILVIGTSTPELVMAVTSAKKGEFDIIIGNIVGTNIFNIGFVLALPIMILGSVTTTNFNFIDMLAITISGAALIKFSGNNRKLDRSEGIIMVLIFVAYYAYLFIK